MEEKALDVGFETHVNDISGLTTDQLATECNGIYQQMEVVGTIGLMMATEIGRRLLTVKDRLPHGSFENWCSENLTFSKRKAERMMLIAKKADDENSILAKTPTLSDLSISKAFAILSAPEDIAAEVVETSDIDDMTVRELQEQIDKLKEEKKEAEEKADWAQTQLDLEIETGEEKKDQELAKAKEQIESLKKSIETLKDGAEGSTNQKEVEELKKQIEKLEAAAKQKETEVENSVKIAVSNSKAEWEKASTKEKEETEQELARLRAEADKLRKDAKLSNNSSMLEFKFQVNAFQTQFNEILKTIGEAELEASGKMAAAFKELMTKLSAKI